ncbi:MAG: 50S ribosomal protein L10 [Candidatus Taylorbacteria bacterium]|nr:50S ribosomal protein L10 [Candidatus Taylorbacteria bacterium]
MAISKEKKKGIIENIGKIVKDSSSVVFVNFHGLLMNDTTELRKTLNAKEVGYTVAKKSLTRKAFAGTKIEGEMPALPGELALVYGKDMTAPAREIYAFQKKFDGKITILGGVFEGKYMDKESMMSIALIPSLQTLRAQFVNVINSPIQRLAVALFQIASKKA